MFARAKNGNVAGSERWSAGLARISHQFSIVSLLVCAGAALIFGQSGLSLTVRVTDPQDKVVVGAIVTLYSRTGSLRLRGTTEQTGQCRFESLGTGDYMIEVEAAGLAQATLQTVRVDRAGAPTVDVKLQLAAMRQQVVVTASGTAQPVDEVSKAIAVVDQRAISARDEFSVAEVIRAVPGLRVQQLGGPVSFASVKTRGLPNEDTAVLIDGARFRDAAAPQGDASGFLADLVVADVDRVEVLRGSGSSLYGTNAIGGVINLVTDEGGGRSRGSLLLEGGGLGMFRGRAQTAGGLQNDRIRYSAGISHLNVSSGVDGDDAARNTSGQGRISFRLSPGTTLSARLYAGNSFVQVNTGPQAIGSLPRAGIIKAAPLAASELRRYESGTPAGGLNAGAANFIPSANDPDNSAAARFFSGLVTLTARPSESIGYTISYHGLTTRRTSRDGPGGISFQPAGGNTRSDFQGNVQTWNAKIAVRAGRFNLIDAGYEFEDENYVNLSFPVNPADNSQVDVTQKSHSIFAQDQLRLGGDRLQLSAAFRAQFFSLDKPEFTPVARAPYQGIRFDAPPHAYVGDGSLAYFFREAGMKIRTHVGNSYRAPSPFERFGTSFGSFGYSAYGDPRLRPDRSISVDAGVDQALLGNRLRASATYYYTRLQETTIFDFSGGIDAATDPFGRFGGYRNTGGGLARGLELSLEGRPTPSLDLAIAYTFTNSDQRRPQVEGVVRSLVIPDHQFSMTATQQLSRRLNVNFDLSLSGRYLAPVFDPGTFVSRAYSFDGIAKADLGFSYRIPVSDYRSIYLYGKVDNLFDRNYYEAGYRTPGVAGVAGMRFEF